MGRLGPGLAWLLVGGFAWTQLLRLTHAGPLYAVALLAGGVGGTLLAAKILTRLFLPYDGEVRRWRRLAKAAPQLKIEAFGGHRPPEAELERGRVKVHLRSVRGQLRVRLRLRDACPEPPALDIQWCCRPLSGPPVGDARLDELLAMEGPRDALLAALTEPVRDELAAHVGPGVHVQPGRASFDGSEALRYPKAFLAQVDALGALLEALDAAVRVPVEQALATPDPSPTVTAVRLRALFERLPPEAACEQAQRYLDAAPPVRWAVAEGLAASPDIHQRAEALRRLREAMNHGDRAARSHAMATLARRFPARLAIAEAREQALRGAAPPLPEAVALLTRAELAGGTFGARLDAMPAGERLELIPVLKNRCAEVALVHLAGGDDDHVATLAFDALEGVGDLDTVRALLALARIPARRAPALRVVRALQQRYGHPARGALSWSEPSGGAGDLSEPV